MHKFSKIYDMDVSEIHTTSSFVQRKEEKCGKKGNRVLTAQPGRSPKPTCPSATAARARKQV